MTDDGLAEAIKHYNEGYNAGFADGRKWASAAEPRDEGLGVDADTSRTLRDVLDHFDDDEVIHSDDYAFEVTVADLRAALANADR